MQIHRRYISDGAIYGGWLITICRDSLEQDVLILVAWYMDLHDPTGFVHQFVFTYEDAVYAGFEAALAMGNNDLPGGSIAWARSQIDQLS